MAKPEGEVTVQTFAMPANTNANGDIFGGWLVSQMDLAASVIAQQCAESRVTTVAIDAMVFHRPVRVGDLVSCYANLTKIGRTSMVIKVEVWVLRSQSYEREQVTEGEFTFVAIDDAGRPQPVNPATSS